MKIDLSAWEDYDSSQGHLTFFGRYSLGDLAVARDLAAQTELPEDLRVLMLACSTGQTVHDLLATLDRELNTDDEVKTRIHIIAVDIAESVTNIARKGHYLPITNYCRLVLARTIPWIHQVIGQGLYVDWDHLEERGHSIRYERFDIDQGLKHLDIDEPCDLVEVRNSHHKTYERDVENISEVLAEDGWVYASTFTDKQGQYYEVVRNILDSIESPETWRFLSGLVGLTEVVPEDREKWLDRLSLRPIIELIVVQQCKLLEALGLKLFAQKDLSDEDKDRVVESEDLLRTLAKFSFARGTFTEPNMWALYMLGQAAKLEALEGLSIFHDHLRKKSIVPLVPFDSHYK